MLRHWGHTLNGVLKKAITIAGEDIPRGPPRGYPWHVRRRSTEMKWVAAGSSPQAATHVQAQCPLVLTLCILRGLPRTPQSILLALLNARITCQESLFTEGWLQSLALTNQSASDAVTDSTRLPAHTSANNLHFHPELAHHLGLSGRASICHVRGSHDEGSQTDH